MTVTVKDIDIAIARWQTRFKRAVNTIDKLQKRRKRMVAREEKLMADLAIVPPLAKPVKPKPTPEPMPPHAPEPMPSPVDTTIPDFLIADQIKAEQAEIKRAKARGRIEKMKAKQRGDLRKMPLTGRAALDAIRNG